MSDKNNVIDLAAHRKDKLEVVRRDYERFLFENFIACSLLLDDNRTILILPDDISKSGMKFTPIKKVDLKNAELVTLRIHFTPERYIDHRVEIVRSELKVEDGIEKFSFACKFDSKHKSYETIGKLIELIESFSNNALKVKNERRGA